MSANSQQVSEGPEGLFSVCVGPDRTSAVRTQLWKQARQPWVGSKSPAQVSDAERKLPSAKRLDPQAEATPSGVRGNGSH